MNNLIGIDLTTPEGESLFLTLDMILLSLKHGSKLKIPCYTSLAELGVDDDVKIEDLMNGLPLNSYLQMEVERKHIGIGVKIFANLSNIIPAVLTIVKTKNRIFSILKSENFEIHRYIYGTSKNDTGWFGLLNQRGRLYVDVGYVSSIDDFIFSGNYYIPRNVSVTIDGFPSDWDCFLKIESFSSTHKIYTIENLTKNFECWKKIISPTIQSEWVKIR